jgi:hypothetical protein
VPCSSRIKVEKEVSGWTEHIWQFYRIYPVKSDFSGPRSDMSTGQFQHDVHSPFWSYFTNRVSIWSHSSSTSFITLWGSFLSCWLVFFIIFHQGFLLGILNMGHRQVSCERNFIWLPFTRPPPVTPSILQLVSELVSSLVVLNRLCDLKLTWRKVPWSSLSLMARISVNGKIGLTTISWAKVV